MFCILSFGTPTLTLIKTTWVRTFHKSAQDDKASSTSFHTKLIYKKNQDFHTYFWMICQSKTIEELYPLQWQHIFTAMATHIHCYGHTHTLPWQHIQFKITKKWMQLYEEILSLMNIFICLNSNIPSDKPEQELT